MMVRSIICQTNLPTAIFSRLATKWINLYILIQRAHKQGKVFQLFDEIWILLAHLLGKKKIFEDD